MKDTKDSNNSDSELRALRTTIPQSLRGLRKFAGNENSRIQKFIPPRRKGAKFGGGRAIFIRFIFTIFSDLWGLGGLAGDIPSFGCGCAALGFRGEHFPSKIVAALPCWDLRGKNIKPTVVDHSNQSFQNQFLKAAN